MTRSLRGVYVGVLRRAARRAGYRLAFDEPPPGDVRRRRMLEADGIDTVLDIGANVGQFGDALRQVGWRGRIVSFEPQAEPFASLRKKASRDGNWEAHRLALGAKRESVEVNVASVHPRSSLLPITSRHRELLPDSTYVRTEEVMCDRLDDAIDGIVSSNSRLALKMDVQGYELHVLEGATETLRRAQLIELEISVIEMYEGQPTAAQLVAFLDKHEFELVSVEAESIDEATGRLNWLNAIFRRR